MNDTNYRFIFDPETKAIVKIDMPTLRDQFAMAALTGLFHNNVITNPKAYAKIAYEMADSMLEARK